MEQLFNKAVYVLIINIMFFITNSFYTVILLLMPMETLMLITFLRIWIYLALKQINRFFFLFNYIT